MSNPKEDDYPRAVVHVHMVDGKLVSNDHDAVAMVRVAGKYNCGNTFRLNADRVAYFKQRLAERGMTADQAVIVLVNVDDVHGGPLAGALMPGHNWQEIRDLGIAPFARGLVAREGIQMLLGAFDQEAAGQLRTMKDDVAVVVVDHGVAEVFAA